MRRDVVSVNKAESWKLKTHIGIPPPPPSCVNVEILSMDIFLINDKVSGYLYLEINSITHKSYLKIFDNGTDCMKIGRQS